MRIWRSRTGSHTCASATREQPNKNAPGFDVDQGTFDPNTENGYVTYTCGGNTWREDTNIRGR